MVNMLSSDFVMKVLGTNISYESGKEYLNIIMTYYDCDLFYYIKQHQKKGMPNFDIKIISYPIIRGLLYIHSRGICHRDIKPHNILLKGKNAVICDFGSAKILING
jgi:glycogen synthase kinase 3 beta